MSRGWSFWLAWGLVGVTFLLHGTSFALDFAARHVTTPGDGDTTVYAAGFLVAFLAFPVVGAVIASRRPGNAIGWLFLATGVAFGLSDLSASYADYAVFANPGVLPAGVWAGWATAWLDPLAFVLIMLVLLLFPEGRVLSPRWRIVLWLIIVDTILGLLWNALKPGKIFKDSLPFDNPAGVRWLEEHLGFVDAVVFIGFASGIALSVVAAVVRFRRSRGIERDRMKWLAYAALTLALSFALVIGLSFTRWGRVGDLVIGLAFTAVPVSVGIGVLRYRLYDIDRVISRTLSFAIVTFALAAVYVGLVLLGQYVFSSLTGGGGLVIAVSTLVVAGLFLPLRSRVQRVVDRRFNRHRYDAERTLAAFGARLREELDLETLSDEMVGVVTYAMQPTRASLWLREARS